MPPRWHLLFTFPSFVPPADTPYVSDEVVICSADDGRLRRLVAGPSSQSARLLLRRFSTDFGDRYRPGCLLMRENAPARTRDAAALSSFRNLCAVATTTNGWGATIGAHAQRVTVWSDAFRFGFYSPAQNGGLTFLDGPVFGFESVNRIRRMRTHSAPQFGRPSAFQAMVDQALLDRMIVAWRRFHIKRREQAQWRPLFRSLEVAFHAGLFPSDGLTTLTDAGTRLALWVSAFEVLFHPGGQGRVNKETVQLALQQVPWIPES